MKKKEELTNRNYEEKGQIFSGEGRVTRTSNLLTGGMRRGEKRTIAIDPNGRARGRRSYMVKFARGRGGLLTKEGRDFSSILDKKKKISQEGEGGRDA